MPETPPGYPNEEALPAPCAPCAQDKGVAASREANLEPTFLEELSAFGGWCAKNPVSVGLLVCIIATLVYFFGFFSPFVNGAESTAAWANKAWNPEGNQEHGRLVPLIALGLIWFHREKLRAAVSAGSNLGLLWLFCGVFFFVLSVRCLQPRLALTSVPFLLYGSVMFVWGRKAAKVILFPCVFLLFMIPVAALEQATFRLQFIITGLVGMLSKLFGIGIQAIGTTLTASDGSFNFEIAEGCSGIRSLAAMTMLTAAYVYLTQDRLWKQGAIFLCSVAFAIIGNVGRIFTVVIIAKLGFTDFAANEYHDWSGYVFFPIAVGAMLLFAKLVNLKSDSRKPGDHPPSAIAGKEPVAL